MSEDRTRILNAAFNVLAERGVAELAPPRVAKAAEDPEGKTPDRPVVPHQAGVVCRPFYVCNFSGNP